VSNPAEEKLGVVVMRERVIPLQRSVYHRKREHCHASHHKEKLLERGPSHRGRLHERCSKKTNRAQCFLFERLRFTLLQDRQMISAGYFRTSLRERFSLVPLLGTLSNFSKNDSHHCPSSWAVCVLRTISCFLCFFSFFSFSFSIFLTFRTFFSLYFSFCVSVFLCPLGSLSNFLLSERFLLVFFLLNHLCLLGLLSNFLIERFPSRVFLFRSRVPFGATIELSLLERFLSCARLFGSLVPFGATIELFL
jgi:hypothetical protein